VYFCAVYAGKVVIRIAGRPNRRSAPWHSSHATDIGQAIDHVGRALIPPSKRDPVALTYIEEAASHLVLPDLATLQGILDEICDGGDALGSMDGRACRR